MTIETPNSNTELENIADAFLPMLLDDGFGATPESKRAEYLSKRVCNFSVREACQLANVSEKSVRRWRAADPTFEYLDTTGMSDLRKKFSTELLDMQFTRNFHLVLQKDFKVLFKDAMDEDLTDDEKSYLIQIRKHYSPQSLAMIKQILGGGNIQEPFNFTKLTLSIKREQETLEIRQE